MRANVAGPDGAALSEGVGPLAAAVRDVMAHQWSNNREAMDALTRLIDAANDAQSVLCMVADISHSGGLALQSPLDALVSVRRLTLEHWNTWGSEADHRDRVLAHAKEVHATSEYMHDRNNALRLYVSDLTAVMLRMVAGIDHLAELARQWEPDHSSGADRRGWVLAKDARDDAWRLLQEHAQRIGPNVRGEA